MNKHKKFIKNAYEGKYGTMCQDWKDTILKHYPEFKEEDFKVGDWVIGRSNDGGQFYPENPVMIKKIESVDELNKFIYWDISDYPRKTSTLSIHLRKATKEEIEQHLIKEAENRGFKRGVKYRCFVTDKIHGIDGELSFEYERDSLYTYVNGRLHHKCYENGKWAEIIPTMTKEEAEKKLGCKII